MRTRWTQPWPPTRWALMAGLILCAGLGVASAADVQPGAATDDEVKAFTVAVERAAAEGDVAGLTSLIDWDAILDTATAGVDVTASFRDKFRKGAKSSIKSSASLAKNVIETAKDGG